MMSSLSCWYASWRGDSSLQHPCRCSRTLTLGMHAARFRFCTPTNAIHYDAHAPEVHKLARGAGIHKLAHTVDVPLPGCKVERCVPPQIDCSRIRVGCKQQLHRTRMTPPGFISSGSGAMGRQRGWDRTRTKTLTIPHLPRSEMEWRPHVFGFRVDVCSRLNEGLNAVGVAHFHASGVQR